MQCMNLGYTREIHVAILLLAILCHHGSKTAEFVTIRSASRSANVVLPFSSSHVWHDCPNRSPIHPFLTSAFTCIIDYRRGFGSVLIPTSRPADICLVVCSIFVSINFICSIQSNYFWHQLSRVWVTVDEVCIGKWICWPFTTYSWK
jgi:hypothetical protein